MAVREHGDEDIEPGIGRGLLNAVLIAIPLWAIIGVALALGLEHEPIGESASAAWMIGIAFEAILLRPYARTLWARILHSIDAGLGALTSASGARIKRLAQRAHGGRESARIDLEKVSGRRIESIEDLLHYVSAKYPASRQVRRAIAPNALFRRSLALSALVGAYLQYYFVDVNLQIASMNSLTVFVPVTL